MLVLYFHIFQGGFEVLDAIFQVSVHVTIVTIVIYYNMYYCSKICDISLVVELLICSKKCFLI